MTRMVDPPSGWMYGFPAPLQEDYSMQLYLAGYPEEEIPWAMENSRYWDDNDGGTKV